MLRRCRVRALERGLASLSAGASLELARRMAYRRQGGSGDEGLGSSNGEENGVSSLAWDSIHSAGRMPMEDVIRLRQPCQRPVVARWHVVDRRQQTFTT